MAVSAESVKTFPNWLLSPSEVPFQQHCLQAVCRNGHPKIVLLQAYCWIAQWYLLQGLSIDPVMPCKQLLAQDTDSSHHLPCVMHATFVPHTS